MLPFIWYFPNLVVPLHAEKREIDFKIPPFLLVFEYLYLTNMLAYNILRLHGRKKNYIYERKY